MLNPVGSIKDVHVNPQCFATRCVHNTLNSTVKRKSRELLWVSCREKGVTGNGANRMFWCFYFNTNQIGKGNRKAGKVTSTEGEGVGYNMLLTNTKPYFAESYYI